MSSTATFHEDEKVHDFVDEVTKDLCLGSCWFVVYRVYCQIVEAGRVEEVKAEIRP